MSRAALDGVLAPLRIAAGRTDVRGPSGRSCPCPEGERLKGPEPLGPSARPGHRSGLGRPPAGRGRPCPCRRHLGQGPSRALVAGHQPPRLSGPLGRSVRSEDGHRRTDPRCQGRALRLRGRLDSDQNPGSPHPIHPLDRLGRAPPHRVGHALAALDPSFRLPCKKKGPRLSLLSVATILWPLIASLPPITPRFLDDHLPPPALRSFPWLKRYGKPL